MAIGADEKKKLIVLGVLLLLITIVVVVLYVPRGGSKPAVVAETPSGMEGNKKNPPAGPLGKGPQAIPATGTPAGTPEGGAAAGGEGGGTGGSGAGSISAASLVSVSNFRPDPFAPVPLPPPLPTPPPPPPPPGPVTINPPSAVDISSPGSGLPPFSVSSSRTVFGGTPPSRILAEMPAPRISRVAIAPTAPRIITPPGESGDGGASRSPGKRLSGVIIGDSVRAILEISDGENTVSRIVQPGDEVDGIRILRIERTNEGGRPVTRMFIRENGEEHYVDLRAAPQQAAGTGEGGLAGGAGRGFRP
jgi:hypothetical protein